jgi:dihydropyrimidine dehydrogenase (NAD+) subunit PreA
MNVDGLVSSGGLGGPAILPLSLAKMSEMTRAFPEKSFSGIGGISEFGHALNYFLLGCGTVQVCTAAMLDHAVGPNVVKGLLREASEFFERNAGRGLRGFTDIVGLRRERIVPHSQIKRPDQVDYQGGHEPQEGYAEPVRG